MVEVWKEAQLSSVQWSQISQRICRRENERCAVVHASNATTNCTASQRRSPTKLRCPISFFLFLFNHWEPEGLMCFGILVLLVFSQNGSLSRTYATDASILLDFKPEIISSFKSQAPGRYIWWDLFETDFFSNLDDSRGEDRVERLVNFSKLRVLLFLLIPMETA